MKAQAEPKWVDGVRQALPITKFHLFHPDVNINFQLNRALIFGEEELFASIAVGIGDIGDWKDQFLSAAARFETAEEWGKAARLSRTAEFFIDQDDPERQHVYDIFMAHFRRSQDTKGFETFAVPYLGGALHALRLPTKVTRRGTVVVHGGFDSYIEEFLDIARAFSAAGYDVVMFDGPGQGTTLMRHGLPMTPHWGRPVGAVLDHFDLDDVTLVGISLGGCLAVRAAAVEPRISRVVAFDAMLDFFKCVTSVNGRAVQWAISALLAARLTRLLDARVAAMMKKDFAVRWGIAQGMHVTGTRTPSEFFAALRDYTTTDVSQRLPQHALVLAGAADHFVPLDQFWGQLAILGNAASVSAELFTAAEDAQSHCQVGNQAEAVIRIIHWMKCHPSARP